MGKRKSLNSPSASDWSSESTENFSEEGEEEDVTPEAEEEESSSESTSSSTTSSTPSSDSSAEDDKTKIQNIPDSQTIITPLWEGKFNEDTSEDLSIMNNFDMSKKHLRLSLLERRINLGEDHVHLHPGMVPNLEKEKDDLNFTDIELEEAGDFKTHFEETIIPTWWPKRPWDKSKDCLDTKESEELLEKIKNSTKRRYGLNYTRSHRLTDNESENQLRKFKRKLILNYSLLDYETDKSDELTDWDESIDLL
ncbi:hypothetical protein TVAG_315930 [Trichomonas vaginalis G3]|uniref:Uncharacterized protein n=1 Tax=Trichomonas vaginalis (strain ATCC PRA-98 / G3) TaxID=412133 RepID=A2G8I6_TRIV3|nr:hypothetical protein TVAGG3_0922010 [Trichomonas vaginalis G3]EAX86526.1 hypothetical protein TVAG_315930 [Trichomonas vaginalis G3]KAI5485187.1 hypothetical protein TVAGG3_0922010 [Trichomonas vaginalis G3]|eukprot:XP_001299456.1 hypothetical protein [Trichomonas vaginalis G3]